MRKITKRVLSIIICSTIAFEAVAMPNERVYASERIIENSNMASNDLLDLSEDNNDTKNELETVTSSINLENIDGTNGDEIINSTVDYIKEQIGAVDVQRIDDSIQIINDLDSDELLVTNDSDKEYVESQGYDYVGTIGNSNMTLARVRDDDSQPVLDESYFEEATIEMYEGLLEILDMKPLTSDEINSAIEVSDRLAPYDNLSEYNDACLQGDDSIDLLNDSIEWTDNNFSGVTFSRLPGLKTVSGDSIEGTASTKLFVIDEDILLVEVTDSDGNPLGGASVCITYKDSSGQTVTKRATTSDGSGSLDIEGCCTFSGMTGKINGFIDIQKSGYHVSTSFNTDLSGGNTITRALVADKGGDEVYVRAADLEGSDILNSEMELSLIGKPTNYKMSILVTNKSSNMPVVSVNAVNNKKSRTIKGSLSGRMGTYTELGNSHTFLYECSDAWGTKGKQLFVHDDNISLSVDGEEFPLSLKTLNAVVDKPMFEKFSFNLLGSGPSVSFDDSIPGVGGGTVSFDIFECPLDIGILPNGFVFVSYNFLDDDQYQKISRSFFDGSYVSPFQQASATSYLRTQLTNQMNAFKALHRNEGDKMGFLPDAFGKAMVYLTVCGIGHYDFDKGELDIDLRVAFGLNADGAIVGYIMIPAGAFFIPVYFGLEGSADVSATIGASLGINTHNGFDIHFNPSGGPTTASGEISPGFTGLGIAITLIVGAFAGIGVKGYGSVELNASAGITGEIDFSPAISDENYDFSSAKSVGDYFPHFKATGFYEISVKAQVFFVKYKQKLTGDQKVLGDTWEKFKLPGAKDSLAGRDKTIDNSWQIEPIDFDILSEDIDAVNLRSDSEKFIADLNSQDTDSGVSTLFSGSNSAIASGVFSDNQSSMVMVNSTYGAIFRITSIEGIPQLVYNRIIDGHVEERINRVTLPEGAPNTVYSYVTAVRGKDEENHNCVNVGIVSGKLINSGGSETIAERRALSCGISALTIDLSKDGAATDCIKQRELVKAPDGKQVYGLKAVAGIDNRTKLAWLQRDIYSVNLYQNKATFCFYDGKTADNSQMYYTYEKQIPFFMVCNEEKTATPYIWLMTSYGKMCPWSTDTNKTYVYNDFLKSDYKFRVPVKKRQDGTRDYNLTYVAVNPEGANYVKGNETVPAFIYADNDSLKYVVFRRSNNPYSIYELSCFSDEIKSFNSDGSNDNKFNLADETYQLIANSGDSSGATLVTFANKYKEGTNVFDHAEAKIYNIRSYKNNKLFGLFKGLDTCISEPLVYNIEGDYVYGSSSSFYRLANANSSSDSVNAPINGLYLLNTEITSDTDSKGNLKLWHQNVVSGFKLSDTTINKIQVKKGDTVKVNFSVQNYGNDVRTLFVRFKDKAGNIIAPSTVKCNNVSQTTALDNGWLSFEGRFVTGAKYNCTADIQIPNSWSGYQNINIEVSTSKLTPTNDSSADGLAVDETLIDSLTIDFDGNSSGALQLDGEMVLYDDTDYAEIQVTNNSLVTSDYVELSAYIVLDDPDDVAFDLEDEKHTIPVGAYWINNRDDNYKLLADEQGVCNFNIEVDKFWSDEDNPAAAVWFVLSEWNEGDTTAQIVDMINFSSPDYDYGIEILSDVTDSEQGYVTGDSWVEDSGSLSLTAVANEGYEFVKWTELLYNPDDASADEDGYVLANLPDNCSVDGTKLTVNYDEDEYGSQVFHAEFKDAGTHNRVNVVTSAYLMDEEGTPQAITGGSVSSNNANVIDSSYTETINDAELKGNRFSISKGEMLNLNATPYNDFKLDGWYDEDGNLLSREYSINLDANAYHEKTIVVRFIEDDTVPASDEEFVNYTDAEGSAEETHLKDNIAKYLEEDDLLSICGHIDRDSTQSYWVRIPETEEMRNSFDKSITFIGADGSIAAPIEEYEDDNYCYIKLNEGGTFLYTWSREKVTVGFDSNGGNVISENRVIPVGDKYGTLPVPVREGYRFIGWYTQKADGEVITADSQVAATDLSETIRTLYAHWRMTGNRLDVEDIPSYVYTGKAIRPVIRVYNEDDLLTLNKDYSVSYKNNVNAGTATVTVTGKGNYTGKVTKYFTINKASLTDASCAEILRTYNKKVQKPVPTVKCGTKKLTNNKDFVFAYSGECKEPGRYALTINAKENGNYKGSIVSSMIILSKAERMMSKVSVKSIASINYDGQSHKIPGSDIIVKYGKDRLIYDEDYDVIYEDDCVNAGKHKILLVGKGKYYGNKEISFTIKGISINKAKMSSITETYTGLAIEPVVTLEYNKTQLIKDVDYNIEYSNNVNLGNGKIIIKGIGKYTGTVTKIFRIYARKLSPENVTVSSAVNYVPGGTTIKPIVKYNNRTLVKDVDYKVTYKNNKKTTDSAVVVVKGMKNFKGTVEKQFAIKTVDIGTLNMVVPDIEYSGRAGKISTPLLIFDKAGNILKAGTDYSKDIEYVKGTQVLDNKSVLQVGDEVTVIVKAKEKGNYSGVISGVYHVVEKGNNVNKFKLTEKITKQYTGTPRTLVNSDFKFTYNKASIPESAFSIVDCSYLNNIKNGTATVYIKGENGYAGIRKITYNIKAQKIINTEE